MSRKLVIAKKNVNEANTILLNEYVRKGEECYKNNDFTGRDYWNERYFQLLSENDLIDMDIRKLKAEMNRDETNSTTRH